MYSIENKSHEIFGFKKILMMENAGNGIAEYVFSMFSTSNQLKKIVIICGPGNNGGDGFVAARHLSGFYNFQLFILVLGSPDKIKTEESKINFKILEQINSISIAYINHHSDAGKIIREADLIIDAIFGTGINKEIQEPYFSIIEAINSSSAYRVAIDIPSGLNPDSGMPSNICVKANTTITFHRMKKGLLKSIEYTGIVLIKKIGIPIEVEQGIVK